MPTDESPPAEAGEAYPPIRLSRPRVLLPLLLWGAVLLLLWSVVAREQPLAVVVVTAIFAVVAVGHVARADLPVGESRLSPTVQRLLAGPLLAGATLSATFGEGPARVTLPLVVLVCLLPTVLPGALPRPVRERFIRMATWNPDSSAGPSGPTVQTWQAGSERSDRAN